jgi:hypothetical protein
MALLLVRKYEVSMPYFWAGTKAYDFLAGSEGIETSYFLTKSKAIDALSYRKLAKIISSQTRRSLRTIVDHCSNDVITLQH